jgi:hypothetical protein
MKCGAGIPDQMTGPKLPKDSIPCSELILSICLTLLKHSLPCREIAEANARIMSHILNFECVVQ